MDVTFTALLWQWQDDGGWHFVTLPQDVADEIDDHVGQRGGFGSVKVTATVGTSTWSTSLFPSNKEQSFLLPVKKPVRTANELEAGDDVTVVLHIDT